EHHILLSHEELAKLGIQVAETSRGGDVTWHGPGQLVMYPIIRLGEKEEDAHGYLHNLEEIAIRTAHDFGVSAFRRKGMTGAWTRPGKLTAIGIRLKRWVTFHGMSFNINPDLSGFEAIIPCGLTGEPVTSLQVLLGQDCPSVTDVRRCMIRHFSEVCQRALQEYHKASDLPSELARIIETYASACL
ncbi:lipoyl(octanoyl) transferase LipB, partial [Verrucomicrobiota bacterium]